MMDRFATRPPTPARRAAGRRALLGACLLAGGACFPLRAAAWNEAGHHIVGRTAFALLSPARQAQVLALLRQHPAFDRHFLGCMPVAVWQADAAAKDQWFVGHSGHWPDLVRGAEPIVTAQETALYDRPLWHYIDLPLFLDPEDEGAVDLGDVNVSFALVADADEATLNAPQAIALHTERLRAAATSPADRAVSLCWLVHLVGDVHQPCHAASLYSRTQFPESDNGGGLIPVGQRTLHGVWDAALLQRTDQAMIAAKVERLRPLAEKVGDAAQATPEQWIRESHELARDLVYAPEVRDAIRGWPAEGERPPLELSLAYMNRLRQTATERAALAAARLAALLDDALPPAGDP
jgi:hypothetical protein